MRAGIVGPGEQALMSDMESDRVERTISTNDTTKFREAIFMCNTLSWAATP